MTDYAAKIKALFAQAEGTDNPQEAETYTAKAEELMVKWGVDDAMLADKRRQQKKAAEKITEAQVRFSGPMCRGMVYLGSAVANGLGLRSLKRNGAKAEGTMVQYVYLIGHESDVKRGEMLLASLTLQCEAARKAWWKGLPAETRKAYSANEAFLAKRQFVTGFAMAVEERLTATRGKVEQELAPSTELVLTKRGEAVDKWLSERYPKMGKSRSIQWGDANGHYAGRKAGNEASLGDEQQVEGGSAQVEQ